MKAISVRLKKQRNGKWRSHWYGQFVLGQIATEVNLNVKWGGTPPASGSMLDRGDADFELSREKAKEALATFEEEARRKGRADHLTERLIEAKTGRKLEYIRLDELAERWRKIGRSAPASQQHLDTCAAVFNRFVDFVRNRNPRTEYLYEVSQDDANGWLADLQTQYAPKTIRDCFKLLRSAFVRMLPTGCTNPFVPLVPSRKGGDGVGTVHRKPFSAEELGKLIEAAKQDEFIYPLLVCAMCTGMRRGDVCQLNWSAVDWENGMLAVKTSKTGETVEIPIFNPLREVLEIQKGKDPDYVFPDAVELLKKNPGAISRRFKKLAAIAFGKLEDTARFAAQSDEGTKAICAALPEGVRRQRIVDVFQRYVAGASYGEIMAATGLPKGTVAQYVRDAQKIVKTPIMRGRGKVIKEAIKQATQIERDNGRMASVRDWHALRATWVTLALSAGVPVELVRRVTGHATVEVVLKHYFRPDRDQFKAALTGALPEVLTGKKETTDRRLQTADQKKEEMAALGAKLADGTATKKDMGRLRELLG